MEDNKAKFQETSIAPMHTAEHLLNQTMVRMFGCERSSNAHIERKKSKISYHLPTCPSDDVVNDIVNKMNELIAADLPVCENFVDISELSENEIARLPKEHSGSTVRIVTIGDYDSCPCIGLHVKSTRELGQFVLLGTNWDEEKENFRIRFKLVTE